MFLSLSKTVDCWDAKIDFKVGFLALSRFSKQTVDFRIFLPSLLRQNVVLKAILTRKIYFKIRFFDLK